MSTLRVFATGLKSGTLPTYPNGSSMIEVLKNVGTNSYVTYKTAGTTTILLTFDVNSLKTQIPVGSKINSITLGISGITNNSVSTTKRDMIVASIDLSDMAMITFTQASKQITMTEKFPTNPATGKAWVITDLSVGMEVTLMSNGSNGLNLYYFYLDVDYEGEEVQQTPLGKIKVKTPKGIITLPFFNPSLISYPALRIKSPKGIGAFSLVETNNSFASPIRVKTPKGIKAIAYIK